MHFKKQTFRFLLATILLPGLVSAWPAMAGDLDSTSEPGSTSGFTLEQIYNAITIDSGHNTTPQAGFTEPGSGPGSTMHTLDEIMAVLIGRVPKTGQTKCYDNNGSVILCGGTGQDAEYRMGTLPVLVPTDTVEVPGASITGTYTILSWEGTRFTDNEDGTVTDNVTGLIWLKNANCLDSGIWTAVLSATIGLATNACGLTDGSVAGDWRMPNINELHSLIDISQSNPAMPSGHPFINIYEGFPGYWSSTTNEGNLSAAWYLNTNFGVTWNNKDKANGVGYVWPVRGGQ